MEQFQGWAEILAVLGVGTLVLEIFKAVFRWLTGRVGRERDAVTYERDLRMKADERFLEEQRRADALDEKLDKEIAKRRAVTTIAGRYEHRLITLGIDPGTLEQWPEGDTLPRYRLPAPGGERRGPDDGSD